MVLISSFLYSVVVIIIRKLGDQATMYHSTFALNVANCLLGYLGSFFIETNLKSFGELLIMITISLSSTLG